ncbi:MAG: hypothetical protein EA379_03420 [Phycisphaerales bacterium]|nr:MAG: hypothetical protein EA379_03420 [Phycisphaerales bacterium]
METEALKKTTTSLSRRWLIKTLIYFVALSGLGVWGLYDGLHAYPKRGAESASHLEYQYLEQAREAGRLLRASVPDPEARLAELRPNRTDIERRRAEASQQNRQQAAADHATDLAQLEWLIALARIGALKPENTVIADPTDRFEALRAEWAAKTAPKPLSSYDIPSQWVIAAFGLGFGAWIAFVLVKAGSKRYRWEPGAMRLTLPSGRSIVPADIKELDKRKWDKWFVTLMLNDGEAVKLDLLRYDPLEAWVLEMEKHTEGYEPPAPPEPKAEEAPASEPDAAAPAEDDSATPQT